MRSEIKNVGNGYIWFYEEGTTVHYGFSESSDAAAAAMSRCRKNEKMILSDCFKDFMKEQEKELKPNTVKRYRQVFKSFIAPVLGGKSMNEISAGEVEDLLKDLIVRGISPTTVSNVKTVLNRVFAAAFHRHMIPYNPMHDVETLRYPKHAKERDAFTEEQLEELGKRLEESRCEPGIKLALRLAAWTGMRIGEVLALQWCDVDWKNGFIKVRHTLVKERGRYVLGSPKTENSVRNVPVSAPHLEELKEWKNDKARKGLVQATARPYKQLLFLSRNFGPISESSVDRVMRHIVSSMKEDNLLDHDGSYVVHSLRHTFATRGARKGLPPKVLGSIMGHGSIKVTMDVYTHVSDEDKKREMEEKGLL